ncbi:uncharacterized protein LOC143882135 [Tasmannia lanceolata]|uniref:uncharacterized protein LOC143882135 n=1 Tax=Tasmannia lanceolata TaxID=3420 RepID=UPI0040645BE7
MVANMKITLNRINKHLGFKAPMEAMTIRNSCSAYPSPSPVDEAASLEGEEDDMPDIVDSHNMLDIDDANGLPEATVLEPGTCIFSGQSDDIVDEANVDEYDDSEILSGPTVEHLESELDTSRAEADIVAGSHEAGPSTESTEHGRESEASVLTDEPLPEIDDREHIVEDYHIVEQIAGLCADTEEILVDIIHVDMVMPMDVTSSTGEITCMFQ